MEETQHKSNNLFIVLAALVVLAGIGTGFLLAKKAPVSANSDNSSIGEIIKSKNEVGSTNTSIYKDSAMGTVEAGGLNGEGTHKLIREGGPSQTVYMISSVVDLNEFVGKKVEVWGQTLKASKAPWLMDVGRLKLVDQQ